MHAKCQHSQINFLIIIKILGGLFCVGSRDGPYLTALRILDLQPRIEPGPSAVKVQS